MGARVGCGEVVYEVAWQGMCAPHTLHSATLLLPPSRARQQTARHTSKRRPSRTSLALRLLDRLKPGVSAVPHALTVGLLAAAHGFEALGAA
jgi:hypothetical protein